ncbi:MAG: flavin monoamine oxidase family protein [Gammaproteobacteria bacterium]
MAGTNKNADVDVAVIGAGAAGIAAARYLSARGLNCRILEARSRRGGRAWTERDSLNLPFDRGCGWLHDAQHNPLRELAEAEGMECTDGLQFRFHLNGRFADKNESQELQDFLDRSYRLLKDEGRAGNDVAAAAVLDRNHPRRPFLNSMVSGINGVDVDAYSTGDAAADEMGENRFLREGLGTLIAGRLGAGLAVTLDCPVRRIVWNGKGVQLETDRGRMRARAAIVTVSTGVLAGGGITFEPDLPDWKRHALDALPMGRTEKIALAFDIDIFGIPENTLLSIEKDGRVVAFHLRLFDDPLAVCYTGGRLADAVADMSGGEAEAFALEYLQHAFGEGIRRHLRAGTVTEWSRDPWSQGSYSAALPGGHAQRAELARPLVPHLQFAGEATQTESFATAHGAWLSGLRAADAVAAALTS